jgi:hypothetical protein
VKKREETDRREKECQSRFLALDIFVSDRNIFVSKATEG